MPAAREYLAVRVTFHRGPVEQLKVTFYTEKGDGEPGTMILETRTNADGFAGCSALVPSGRYVCTIESQINGGKLVPVVITTVPDLDHPLAVPLPLGRPHFDVCDVEPVSLGALDRRAQIAERKAKEAELAAKRAAPRNRPAAEGRAKVLRQAADEAKKAHQDAKDAKTKARKTLDEGEVDPAPLQGKQGDPPKTLPTTASLPVIRLRPVKLPKRPRAEIVGAAFAVEVGGALPEDAALSIALYEAKDPVTKKGTVKKIKGATVAGKVPKGTRAFHPDADPSKIAAGPIVRGDAKKPKEESLVAFELGGKWLDVPIHWHRSHATDRVFLEARIETAAYAARSNVVGVAHAAALVPSPEHATYDWHEGNTVTLYNDGAEGPPDASGKTTGAFNDIVKAIRQAKEFVFVVDWSFHAYFRVERANTNLSTGTIGKILCEAKRARPDLVVAILTWKHEIFLVPNGLNLGADAQNDAAATILRAMAGGEEKDAPLVAVDATGTGTSNTHHQKFVVLDYAPEASKETRREIKAFFGGLDLSRGRFDWHEHVVSPSASDVAGFKKEVLVTKKWKPVETPKDTPDDDKTVDDWYNAEVGALGLSRAEAHGLPRQPWHDIHGQIQGPAAWDFVHEFVGRFKEANPSKRAVEAVENLFAKLRRRDNFVQQYERHASVTGPFAAQVVRSTTPARWTPPLDGAYPAQLEADRELSIQRAYLRAIERAERFIYIETQYLIGADREQWLGDTTEGHVLNALPDAIIERILARAKDKKDFHVYVVAPLFPEGDPAGTLLRMVTQARIIRYEWRTLEYIIHHVQEGLKKAGVTQKTWRDYVSFFFLANTDAQGTQASTGGGRIYKVRGGDDLMLHVIARNEYAGIKDPDPARFWRHVYCHPQNRAFRALRPNPDRYQAGDEIYLPPASEISSIDAAIGANMGNPYFSTNDWEPLGQWSLNLGIDGSLWPLVRYDPENKAKVWSGQSYFDRRIPLGGSRLRVPVPPSATTDAPNPGDRVARLRNNKRYMVYVHSKMMIVDDQYIILGTANLNERSLSGDRDTEACVALWPSKPEDVGACQKQAKQLRSRLFEEHYGELPPGWEQPEGRSCIRAMQDRADHNYVQLACYRPVTGHLARLPLEYPATVAKVDTGPFSKKRTSLGKFSHGNFDVEYDPKSAALNVTFRARFKFEDGITPASQAIVKGRVQNAVARWDGAHVFLSTTNAGALNTAIRIRFHFVEDNADYHKIVDVEAKRTWPFKRPWVGMDVNISQYTPEATLTHELGHVFGNYDEYKAPGIAGFFENLMYWNDHGSAESSNDMMNTGEKDFKLRYFDHFARFVNNEFRSLDIEYQLGQGTPPPPLPHAVEPVLGLKTTAAIGVRDNDNDTSLIMDYDTHRKSKYALRGSGGLLGDNSFE